jgi:hypothetical protein
MDDREKLINEIFGIEPGNRPKPPINTQPLFPLREIWPAVIERLKNLLLDAGELSHAATMDDLQVYDRCRCGADDCATVYTQPRPEGRYGPTHHNLVFWNADTIDLDTGARVGDSSAAPTTTYTTILDIVDGHIACIEILGDQESHRLLVAALPDIK